MSEIKFDDGLSSSVSPRDNLIYSRLNKSSDRPSLVGFLMKKAGVGSEKSANAILLIISGIFFLSAVAVIYFY